MGEDGHVASLFPGSPILEDGLDPDGARLVLAAPPGEPAPPQARISLTLAALLRSRLIVVLTTGAAKRRTLEEALGRRGVSGSLSPGAGPGSRPRALGAVGEGLMQSAILDVTERIVERSREGRADYLERMDAAHRDGPGRAKLSCANWAHAFAASPDGDKATMRSPTAPNIGIVSAYNDMLSAHQPLERFPEIIKEAARSVGATAQFAGGVPAMCDGVTQGRPGMELSLFSRDVIAMATAVALTHDAFDGALCLGVCDKIVPGLTIGALRLRAPAGDLLPRRADDHGPVQRREGQDPDALRRGQGHPRGAA